jgi:3-hydroxyacyl-CoA dehydrogenase / 3-hydroxy-2-methylbutyryl-CoA dehydrogenase
MKIKDIKAIVTGGASGLGEATVRSLVAGGAKVAIIDMDQDKGQRVAAELGGSVFFYRGDVSQDKQMDEIVEKIKGDLGRFNAVINCAGVGGSVKIMGKEGRMPMERFMRTLNINLLGTFIVIRATVPAMMENEPNEEGERGVVINTASIAAFDGQIGQCAYAATKGGIVSMALTLAREFANNGIRVMTILPGIMDTPLMMGANTDAIRARLESQVPFPARFGKAPEYAHLALAILENPYLNGEYIRLDGALRMGFGRK